MQKKEETIPKEFALYQNYPNPFNPITNIEFDVAERTRVRIEVYDVLGRVVGVVVDGEFDAGRYVYRFDGVGLSSGVYYCVMRAGKFVDVKKMMLVK
ncbi:MAG: T9SS type A sorting domain-containing protein [Candidatus Kryptonium sp.]